MYFTLRWTPSSTASPIPQLSYSNQNSIFNFTSFRPKRHHCRRFSVKSSCKPQTPPREPPTVASATRFGEASATTTLSKQKRRLASCFYEDDKSSNNVLRRIAKSIVFALVCVSIRFCPLGRGLQLPAIAAPVASKISKRTKSKGNDVVQKQKDHEYSKFTRRLLKTESELIGCIEQVRSGNGDSQTVEAALREVKLKKGELQEEIMNELYAQLSELNGAKKELVEKSDEIFESVLKANWEHESLLTKAQARVDSGGEEVQERIAKLEKQMRDGEAKYNEIWEKVGDVEDRILMRDTMALNIGVRELLFIEKESELLVEEFRQEMQRQSKSLPKTPLTKLSRSDIRKELRSARRQFWEQKILPRVLEAEDIGYSFDQDSMKFAQRINQALKNSRQLQSNLEVGIRKKMKRLGDEKRFIVTTPADEVVKGFPEVELKWMFGSKEVVLPKAASLHLFHGWKKWREEAKAELKRNLLEDVDFGKKYAAERQERILMDRDRVASKTWYNEERNRWEMEPIAVPYAVSRKLVESARIRHDWAAMFVGLKGDEREYFLDIKEFEVLFKDFGGFDGLYLRMLASGIPTAVQLMWIPFPELDFRHQFLFIMSLSQQCLNRLWSTGIVSSTREWVLDNIVYTTEDILMMTVFPLVEFIITSLFTEETVGPVWYLQFQSLVETSFKSRTTDDINWFLWSLWFSIRSIIYGYVLLHLSRFMKGIVLELLDFGPSRTDPNLRKLRRLKSYLKYRRRSFSRKAKGGTDPISSAFDQMKRVKNPPMRLKDFACVESMREEINEVVAFLQNPRAFQEIGARPPRGVLIVGEMGTGKTSLALAIAAEAKVPVVEVRAKQLEGGRFVGQGASNIRDLFQTARDLAPVIIFVEDFDLFAGVRGKFIHTIKQDHEAFINQLLVELDGFEKQEGVVLMATTQHVNRIDKALRRPGRMDRVFHLQRPTQTEREKILQISAKETMDEELIDFVDWRKVAEKTEFLRPFELKLVPVALEGSAFRNKILDTDELMSYVSWFATFSHIIPKWARKTRVMKRMSKMLVNHLGLTLTIEDLRNVVDLMEPYGQISNGIEMLNPPMEQWTKETKFPHAVWAAGRGLITFLLPNFDVADSLWLEPSSWEGIGCTKITKAKSEGSMKGNVASRSYLEKKLVFCFGSHVAAQLLLPFGEENNLSSSDLKQAQEIATRMVIQYGWGPDDSPTIYFHGNAVRTLSMGNNHEYEMAAKVEKMYDLAYDKAKKMLRNNRRVLEKIVEELLEFEILAGKDLDRIFTANGGIREIEPFFLSNIHEEPVFSSILENGSVSGGALFSAAN